MKQGIKILRWADLAGLAETLYSMMASGYTIVTVTHSGEFKYPPNMGGYAVSDWLIIYEVPAQEESSQETP